MNQKLSISLLMGGLGTFLTSLGELIGNHSSWVELSTPHEISSIMILTGSFILTIVGALGTKLPRSHNSRVSDSKLIEINGDKNDEK